MNDAGHIVVVGDLMLDRYWFGDTGRVSPEAPVPVVNVGREQDFPGGAGNVARNVVSLGGQCLLLGVIGDDAHGRSMCAALDDAGVRRELVTVPDWPTITKLRVVSRNQQLLRADFERPVPESAAAALVALFDAALDGAAAAILSDYDKGTLAQAEALIAAARRHGVPVLVDPKYQDFVRYRGATVIKPNWQEFRAAAGAAADADFEAAGRALLERLDVHALVLTRGAAGIWYAHRGGGGASLPAHRVEVFDVSGAGDTVMAGLAVALSESDADVPFDDHRFLNAIRFANAAGALAVSHAGTARVERERVDALLAESADAARAVFGGGVVDADTLRTRVESARARGQRIVFTNGCFDLLHPGHVRYLASAAALGDALIVAVNSDASVRRLKGPERPVQSLPHRLEVLAGLASVTWAVAFEEDTPRCLLELLQPDVLVKGGDYRVDEVVGADIVRGYGGEVRVLDVVDGVSTTRLVEKIRARVG